MFGNRSPNLFLIPSVRDNESYKSGGGLCFDNRHTIRFPGPGAHSNITIVNSHFTGSKAPSGGHLAFNTATSPFKRYPYQSSPYTVTLRDSLFANATAGNGGVIYLSPTLNVTILLRDNVTFVNNQAIEGDQKRAKKLS